MSINGKKVKVVANSWPVYIAGNFQELWFHAYMNKGSVEIWNTCDCYVPQI